MRPSRPSAPVNSQDYWASDLQSHCRVEAAATLLDGGEMEPRRVGDRLDVGGVLRVAIISRDCRKTRIQGQAGDRRRKWEVGVKIRIMRIVAIPRPPTGVDLERHEIGEP